MASNYGYGKITTNGLILALNAADKNSYPGSGTAWYNLAGSGQMTLYNGPVFNSANAGNIDFDGSNDYGVISVEMPLAMTVVTIAKSDTFYWNNYAGLGSARGNNGYIIHNDPNQTGVRSYVVSSSGTYYNLGSSYPSNIQNWNMYTLTTNGSNSHKFYINTTQTINSTLSIIRSSGSIIDNYLAKDSTLSRYTNLKIAAHMIYNRVLSASEISQNYNAFKTRFGL